mmetsp:Transcript_13054/g.42553  ORF Transcript_13054/g.42553 Transcript_13054/m.42553 type:complete len:377 (+) Transcript_13054:1135-2265(+)
MLRLKSSFSRRLRRSFRFSFLCRVLRDALGCAAEGLKSTEPASSFLSSCRSCRRVVMLWGALKGVFGGVPFPRPRKRDDAEPVHHGEEEDDERLKKKRRPKPKHDLVRLRDPVLDLVLVYFDAATYCAMEGSCRTLREHVTRSPASRRMWASLARGFPSFKMQMKMLAAEASLKRLFKANATMRLPLEITLGGGPGDGAGASPKFNDFAFTVEVSTRRRARVYAAALNPRRVFAGGASAGSLRTRPLSLASCANARPRSSIVRVLCAKRHTGEQALLYEATFLDPRATHPTSHFFAPQTHRLRGKDVIVRVYFAPHDVHGLNDPANVFRATTLPSNGDGARRYYVTFQLRTGIGGPLRRLHRREILAFLDRWLHFV